MPARSPWCRWTSATWTSLVPLSGWLDRVSDRICEASGVDQEGFDTGIRPIAHVGRKISVPSNPRNSSASGQLAANASLTRLVVSLIRTAIFSNRSRMVENSPLANGCGLCCAPLLVLGCSVY